MAIKVGSALELAEESLQRAGLGDVIKMGGKSVAARISDDAVLESVEAEYHLIKKRREIAVTITFGALLRAGLKVSSFVNGGVFFYEGARFKVENLRRVKAERSLRFNGIGSNS